MGFQGLVSEFSEVSPIIANKRNTNVKDPGGELSYV